LKDTSENCAKEMVVMLIGNKCDLTEDRQVSREEGEAFALRHGLIFMETSAKTAENVEEAFIGTAREIMARITNGDLDVSKDSCGVKIGEDPTLKGKTGGGGGGGGGCCK
jgi:Ras-related protein Rab-2A